MTSPQSLLRIPGRASPLTPEEWNLIIEALKSYQHHSAFRTVYEKVSRLHLAQEGVPRANDP